MLELCQQAVSRQTLGFGRMDLKGIAQTPSGRARLGGETTGELKEPDVHYKDGEQEI